MKIFISIFIQILFLSIAYFLAGKLSLLLAIPPGFATPVWPAAGIALAGILLGGYRLLPAVFIGSFATNLLIATQAGASMASASSLIVAGGIALGAVLQAGVGALFVRQVLDVDSPLTKARDIILIMVRGGVIACLINAFLGPLVLLGMGVIPASVYFISVFTWWVGDVIGVILFMPMLLLLANKRISLARKAFIGIPILIFSILTILIFVNAKDNVLGRKQRDFDLVARNITMEFEKDLQTYLNLLTANARFINASNYVSAEEFEIFTGKFLELYPSIHSLSWNRKITHDQRQDFEKDIKDQGYPDFTVKDRFGVGKIEPATRRDMYFPVTYVVPYEKNAAAHGFDTYSIDEVAANSRRDTLDRARDEGVPITTGRISLVQAADQYGLLIYNPVYSNDLENESLSARRKHIIGYTAGVFIMPTMMAPVKNMADQQGVDIILRDLNTDISRQFLYDSRTPDFKEPQEPLPIAKDVSSSSIKFNVAGHIWELQFIQKPENAAGAQSWNLWYLLIGGMLFSSIFGVFLFVISANMEQAQEEIRQQNSREAFSSAWYGSAASVLVVLLTLALWQHFKDQGNQTIEAAVQEQLHITELSIMERINSSIIAQQRMGQRWEAARGTPKMQWYEDAWHYVEDFGPLTTLEWVDSTYHVRWVEPLEGNEKALGLNIAFNEEREKVLAGAAQKNKITLTPLLDLVQGYRAFIAYIPVYVAEKFDGFIVGIYDTEIFAQEILPESVLENFHVFIMDGEKNFAGSTEASGKCSEWCHETTLFVFGRDWTVLIWPKQAFLQKHRSVMALSVLIGGILFALVIGFAIYYALLSNRRSLLLQQSSIALQESEERVKLILDHAGEGIYGLDLRGFTIFANKAAEDILGYALEEMLNTSQHDLIHHHYPDGTEYRREDCNIYKAFKEGITSIEDSEVFWDKKGDAIPVEYTSAPIKDDKGKISGAVVVFRDIRERKAAENQIEIINQELQRSSQLKSEFLANMSHEIRTPLNGIIGAADLLKKMELTKDQEKYLNIITGSGDNLLTLINDILDISKIEAGELEINPAPVVIRDCIENAVHSIAYKANAKNIEIVVDYEGDVPLVVETDIVRLNQILINLLGNAVKFVEKGYVAIRIKELKTKNNHVTLSFSVEDTGIGIPADKLESIFDKFAQADASTTKEYGGTGLGLAITQRLIEMMGGKIDVVSEAGVGTTFSFDLTFLVIEQSDKKKGEETRKEIENLKVLVVDDMDVSLKFFSIALQRFGLAHELVKKAEDTIQVLEKAHQDGEPFDLCLIDYYMPDMNGANLANLIRNHDDLKDIKLIMVTAMGKVEAKDRNMQDLVENGHFDDYLLKPVNLHDLRQKIYEVCVLDNKKDLASMQLPDKGVMESLGANILLVENEMVNQMVATDMLEGMGCTVDLAENGQEAVDLLKANENKYAVILMDCMMPVMDGFEATKAIRRHEEETGGTHQIIIAMTANAMAEEKDECLKVGMDDYLSKPVKEKTLYTKLKEYINKGEAT